MKKIIILAALALALIVGTATVMTPIHPQTAMADGSGCSGSGC